MREILPASWDMYGGDCKKVIVECLLMKLLMAARTSAQKE